MNHRCGVSRQTQAEALFPVASQGTWGEILRGMGESQSSCWIDSADSPDLLLTSSWTPGPRFLV